MSNLQTTFYIDFSRFESKGLTENFINILHRRCIDAAAANIGLNVIFNIKSIQRKKRNPKQLDITSIDTKGDNK